MSEQIDSKQSPGIDRRQWITSAATLAAGAAAAPFVSTDVEADSAAPAPKSSTSRTILAPNNGNIVEIECGKIRGFSRNGILTFRGIPYAASTAGKARYMAPTKPTPWASVRSCMALGFACPQPCHVPEGRRVGWTHDEEAFMFEWDDGQPGEDCLRVNVWTPSTADTTKRPVLVWIHGGGYTSGSSNELRMYDGESLARRGNVVVVSLNHRLGPLGYMNLQDYGDKWSSAVNLGQLDQIAALEWVRDNIGRFGGDPSKVLVFGQSGGGGKISTLMGMPAAKGLFHRAVIQSGSSLRQITPDRSASLAAAMLQELGLTKATVDRLQEVPVDTIIQGTRVRVLVPVADPGARWTPARLSLRGTAVRVRQQRSVFGDDRRRRGCARARRQDGGRLGGLRSQRQPESRWLAAVARVLSGQVRNDDLRHDVSGEEQSRSRGTYGARVIGSGEASAVVGV
jgi:para-nitrobenzyl esterase